MQTHSQIHEGMKVHSREGADLGKIVQCTDEAFIIEKGMFFPKDYVARYEYIVDVRGDDDVYLSLSKDELLSGRGARPDEELGTEPPAMPKEDRALGSTETAATGEVARGAAGTINVPLTEEELSVEKRTQQAGEVRVTKHVVTEQKQIEVPVSHEEVRVEQVPAGERSATAGQAEATFQEGEIRIPIHEERVELRKTPVVKEEVRISKEAKTEQATFEGEVKKEVAEVSKEGRVTEREVPPSKK